MGTDIWTFGYDETSKSLYMGGSKSAFELLMSFDQIKLAPRATLCKTTMPSGIIDYSSCN